MAVGRLAVGGRAAELAAALGAVVVQGGLGGLFVRVGGVDVALAGEEGAEGGGAGFDLGLSEGLVVVVVVDVSYCCGGGGAGGEGEEEEGDGVAELHFDLV